MTTSYDLKAEAQRLLDLTSQQTRIKTLADRARKRVDRAIRDLYDDTGAVGKFKIRGLGEVRLDGIDAAPKPYVANAETYAHYMVERQPEHVVATIEEPAKVLEDALEALELAGIGDVQSKITVREAFVTKHLADIELEENPEHAAHPTTESKWLGFDTTTGDQVPGLAGRAGSPVLKVVLDRDHKISLEVDAEREDDDAARDLGYGAGEDAAADDAAMSELADAEAQDAKDHAAATAFPSDGES